ncbi:putative cobaltochelatase [Methylobacter tundripaludum]|uniref:Mg-protoporphyrin IX chelatase n=1 Tax=Methylobacter tundripaludum (strain ATCC BAA-1195 / DSM 17260 / SV96) TaxID=697282 RepID=G3J1R7_METTV|nr:putative cobaltochelatase [Methylobacter tundripaludum]EGW19673.1 Magnesium chelatase [Methylobacter tundripaludum SV96]
MNHATFPFSAIVEQTQLKTALLLCAVDPSLGGVLIRGDKGTAKSTAARALTDILPLIERVDGCAFNCAPGAPYKYCETCNTEHATAQADSVPFVTLPLGATEDRVIGTLDLEQALKGGQRVFKPGLLAAAHRGILYIDEVNLLPDHLVDVLLDAAAMGVNAVQREGLSVSHPARFTLIGTMNLEEGDLRPQLLDRFGLMVEVTAPRDKVLRSEVVRRRIAFEANPTAYAAAWMAKQQTLRHQLATAQLLLPKVTLDDALLDLISHLCCEFEVASLRADIVMHKAARALAALEGRSQVTPEDVRGAAELVLPHRRRRKPFEQPGLDKDQLDELMQQALQPPDEGESDADTEQENNQDNGESQDQQQVFATASAGNVRRIEVDTVANRYASGKRSTAQDAPRGRVVRVVQDQNPSSLAVGATLRSAALRGADDFQVTKSDLHQQVRVGKNANLILFVVDASGSMAAQRRMEVVKGAVLSLLTDAYQQRDEVAVISFRGESAQLMLSPTRSVDLAEQNLRELPTGGRTPLPHALSVALETLEKTSMPPLLVLLTDGKANVALTDGNDPWQESLRFAELLAERSVPALVLDTETGYLRLGRARQLAQALGAECLTLEELSAENLALTVRGCIK